MKKKRSKLEVDTFRVTPACWRVTEGGTGAVIWWTMKSCVILRWRVA